MAKTGYFLLCENFIYDNESRVTLVNVYDLINTTDVPVVASRFMLAVSLRNITNTDLNDGKLSVRIEVVDKNGEKIANAEAVETIDTTKNVATVVDFSNAITFKSLGKHTAKLYVHDKQISDYEFTVKKVKAPK